MSQSLTAASKLTSIACTVLGVSTRALTLVLLKSGIWALGPIASAAFDLGTEQVIGQRLGFLLMRSALDNGQRVGNEESADAVEITIGVDDCHGTAGVDLAHGVVGVGQPDCDLPRSDGRGHLLVARQHLHIVGFQCAEKGFRLLVTPGGEEACRVGCGGAEEGLGDADLPFPPRIESDRLSPWAGWPPRQASC